MANKPINAVWICPQCKRPLPLVWNGNYKLTCPYCHTKSTVKRQRLTVLGEAKHVPEEVQKLVDAKRKRR